jgi:hypothetical protein
LWGGNEGGAGDLAQRLRSDLQKERARLSGAAQGLDYSFEDLSVLADEYGIAPNHSLIGLARAFLVALPADIPAPSLDLDQDGDLVFDWRGPSGAMLTVCMATDGHLNFAARFNERETRSGQDMFDDAIPADLVGLARKAFAKR